MANLAALRHAVFFAICEKPYGGGGEINPPTGARVNIQFFLNKFSPNPLIGRIGKDRAPLSRACCVGSVLYLPIAQFRVYGRI